jgi:hypothetical protein
MTSPKRAAGILRYAENETSSGKEDRKEKVGGGGHTEHIISAPLSAAWMSSNVIRPGSSSPPGALNRFIRTQLCSRLFTCS